MKKDSYGAPILTEKERAHQIKKEATISMIMYAAFFLWWYFTGYGLGSGDPKDYTYIFGLPMWFFLSCIVGYVGFCVATIIVVKKVFKNFSLEESLDDEMEAKAGDQNE
ncbi:YhdT family protein [Aminicella lysinilytica]|uniref:Putative membrane protein YhdT n=1 Tax=Aminicella lysinilytica TaxID=433323 RepID=A0A4R6PWJ0_9FIRM|nr:YhdT family protein [Aminicella lysinilytica]NLD11520.1 YhdT family protein [Clostridiales bacterium]TDP44783.1 putative membrane protein YhdT [Aminicella lysinilytica]